MTTLDGSPDDGSALRAAIKKASSRNPAGASFRWAINTSRSGDITLQVPKSPPHTDRGSGSFGPSVFTQTLMTPKKYLIKTQNVPKNLRGISKLIYVCIRPYMRLEKNRFSVLVHLLSALPFLLLPFIIQYLLRKQNK